LSAAGRVTTVTLPDSRQVSFTYLDQVPETFAWDANSNRTTYPGGLTGVYDDQDRLVSLVDEAPDPDVVVVTFTYTLNGELGSRVDASGTTTYTYDVLGNLRQVDLPDGRSVRYLIDGRNRRVGKEVRAQGSQVYVFERGWLYQDQLEPVAELDAQGEVETLFVYGSWPFVPDYLVQDGVTYRILSDPLGSPRMVVRVDDGVAVQRIDYSTWGAPTITGDPDIQPFGFTGGLWDADTGLLRLGARDYDPVLGRWTAKDPILFAGGDANLYGYAAQDPGNLVDTSGYRVSHCRYLGFHSVIRIDRSAGHDGDYQFGPNYLELDSPARLLAWVLGQWVPGIVGRLDVGDGATECSVVSDGDGEYDEHVYRKIRRDMAKKPAYSYLLYNCNDWADEIIGGPQKRSHRSIADDMSQLGN